MEAGFDHNKEPEFFGLKRSPGHEEPAFSTEAASKISLKV